MTCPRCYAEFKPGAEACPECGVRLAHNVSGVMKTSAVMIAAGDEHGFYQSVQDVPEPLRTQLIEITNSANAGTIVIADRAGKEQLTQVIARRNSAREHAAAASGPGGNTSGRNPLSSFPRFSFPRFWSECSWTAWAGVVLLLLACTIIAAVFATRW
jgi:hypothetical protein